MYVVYACLCKKINVHTGIHGIVQSCLFNTGISQKSKLGRRARPAIHRFSEIDHFWRDFGSLILKHPL